MDLKVARKMVRQSERGMDVPNIGIAVGFIEAYDKAKVLVEALEYVSLNENRPRFFTKVVKESLSRYQKEVGNES